MQKGFKGALGTHHELKATNRANTLRPSSSVRPFACLALSPRSFSGHCQDAPEIRICKETKGEGTKMAQFGTFRGHSWIQTSALEPMQGNLNSAYGFLELSAGLAFLLPLGEHLLQRHDLPARCKSKLHRPPGHPPLKRPSPLLSIPQAWPTDSSNPWPLICLALVSLLPLGLGLGASRETCGGAVSLGGGVQGVQA